MEQQQRHQTHDFGCQSTTDNRTTDVMMAVSASIFAVFHIVGPALIDINFAYTYPTTRHFKYLSVCRKIKSYVNYNLFAP